MDSYDYILVIILSFTQKYDITESLESSKISQYSIKLSISLLSICYNCTIVFFILCQF